jgi:hypothetical protein
MRGGLFGPTYIDWMISIIYDNIMAKIRAEYIKIPICVCLNNHSNGDVYLFFNNNMTAEEASFIVKKVLGITYEFVLEPALPIVPITDEETSQDEYLNHTFVKLSKKFIGYSVRTGTVIDYTTDFDTVATAEHEIKKGKTNTDNIRWNFVSEVHKVNDNVLPELYKEYIPKKSESESYGYDESKYYEYHTAMKRNVEVHTFSNNMVWKHFTTVKGKTPINLDLVDEQLLKYYPYFKKGWWVEQEKLLLEKKKKDEEDSVAAMAAKAEADEESLRQDYAGYRL